MKAQELRSMTKEELELKITSLQEEFYRLNYEAKAGRAEKPHRFKQIKRDIARCRTLLREMDLKGAQIGKG